MSKLSVAGLAYVAVCAALLYCACYKTFAAAALVLLWSWTPTDNGGEADRLARKRRNIITEKFHTAKVPQGLDAIVIGAGMAGLHCAATLARLGKRVLVLEQHTIAGGGTHMYEMGEQHYKFDSGLHYVVPWCGPIMDLVVGGDAPAMHFDLMGEEDGTFDRVVLGDDPPFSIKHKEAHMADLYAMFPDDKAALDEYMRITDAILGSVQTFGIGKFLPLWLQPAYARWRLGTFRKWAGRTTKSVLQELTPNKKLQAMLASLWIDTGSPPHKATFMLTASVFRGLPREGGAYPRGGSDEMAKCLVPVIERTGGKVLVSANVVEIVYDDAQQRVTGVLMADGTTISAPVVVSSAGYVNTFSKLIPEAVTTRYAVPRSLPIANSAGFVMCNIGIQGRPADFDITCANLWYHPIQKHGYDLFAATEDFLADPMSHEPAAMITFPSMKDRAWESQHPTKIVCQILVMAEFEWFQRWQDELSGKRGDEYNMLKEKWQEKCLAILYKFYPKVKGHVDFVDLSTPLSIQYYLSEPEGGAVGLDQTPERFTEWEIQRHLDMSTPIPGLWQTGQDTFICGQPLVQLAGIIAGARIGGLRGMLSLVGWGVKKALRAQLFRDLDFAGAKQE